MEPIKLPLTLRRNDDPRRLRFNVFEVDDVTGARVPYDMSGHSGRMQVRSWAGADGGPYVDIDTTLTTAGSGLVFDSEGFDLIIYPDDTSFPWDDEAAAEKLPLNLQYDILITDPAGDTNPWYFGDFTASEGVTPA